MQWLSLREPTDGRPYSSLCDCPCRLSGVHAPSHVHDRRGRCWRVIHDHHHHRRRPWHGGFNDCQTDSTLLSEFHAKTVLMACVIGESRECRSGADVQLQRECASRAGGVSCRSMFQGRSFACILEDNHYSPHRSHNSDFA
jgi:hypothetical protein